ncbi:MAG: hypothetical protein JXA41_02995 [Deltaproteobacteria bacterium]|nr:hypothetical protein [Deltaproteobacteria bacterium]
MRRHLSVFKLFVILATLSFMFCPKAGAGWETGVKAGYDTNVNRSLIDERSDSYLTGYLSFSREAPREKNLDWTFDVNLEASAYARLSDLNCVMLTVAPGVVFNPFSKWTVNVAPFIQGKAVSDGNQTAVAFGGKIMLKQQWTQTVYTGEYVMYADSRADNDVYSYDETAAGLYAGVNWTSAFFSEIGYEYARGDSFRSVGEIVVQGAGHGRRPRYSSTFNEYIISEPVNRHTIGLNLGYQFSRSFFSFINYAYVTYRGDTGRSKSYTAAFGLGYEF